MIADLKKNTDARMHKSVEAFKVDLAKIRTGRAHPGILDHVTVDYYGAQTPLNQVAKITLIDGRTIGVSPFEKKLGQAIEKAIRESNLGLNPASAGDMIRVPMPSLTEERRKELAKVVHKEAETARVSVRNLRRDANEHLKKLLKDKLATEDDERRALEDVQKITDQHVSLIDDLQKKKDQELLGK